MTDVHNIMQVKGFDQRGKVIRERVVVVSIPRLIRPTVTTPVMCYAPKAPRP
jgi:hypothetical protein